MPPIPKQQSKRRKASKRTKPSKVLQASKEPLPPSVIQGPSIDLVRTDLQRRYIATAKTVVLDSEALNKIPGCSVVVDKARKRITGRCQGVVIYTATAHDIPNMWEVQCTVNVQLRWRISGEPHATNPT